jgi:hypothetical protein
MKKTFLGIAVLCIIGLLGCSNVLDGSTGTKTGAEDPADLARVLIPLPKSGARNIAEAQANTNLFEAIFYKYGEDGSKYEITYNESATAKDEYIEIVLPVGTYDILILAGDRYSSTESYDGYNSSEWVGDVRIYYSHPILLASGSAVEQTLSVGENTIPITLYSVDYSLSIPSTLDVRAKYDVSVQYILRNSFLWEKVYYINPYLYFTNESGTSTSIYSRSVSYGNEDREDVRTQQNVGPATAETGTIRGYSYLSNSYGLSSSFTWYFFNNSHPTYGNRVPSSITFSAANLPRVALDLTWGDE